MTSLATFALCLIAVPGDAAADAVRTPSVADGLAPADIEAFAAEHHPELGRLLRQLRRTPPAYDAAIRDVSRQVRRLAKVRERGGEERYRSELERWKLESRIKLAAARVAKERRRSPERSRPTAAERELRELVDQRRSQRLKLIADEQARLAERLAALNAEQSRLTSETEPYVDAEIDRLLRSAEAARRRTERAAASASQGQSGSPGQEKPSSAPPRM